MESYAMILGMSSKTKQKNTRVVSIMLTLSCIAVCGGDVLAQPRSPASTEAGLVDGSRLVGQLRPSSSSGLVLAAGQLGQLTIPWDAVDHVAFGDPVRVTKKDGTVAEGTASIKDGVLTLQTSASSSPVSVGMADLATLEWTEQPGPTWRDRVHATGVSSFDLMRGNTQTQQLYLSASMAYRATDVGLGMYAERSVNQVGASPEIDTVADSAQAGSRLDRYVGSSTFVFFSGDYKHDRFQKVQRLWATAGAGRDLLSTTRGVVSVMAGVSRGRDAEERSIGSTRPQEIEASRTYWQLRLSAGARARLGREGTELAHDVVLYRQLGAAVANVSAGAGRGGVRLAIPLTGLMRTEMTSRLAVPLARGISWQAQANFSATNHPYPGATSKDLALSTGIRLDFGNDTLSGYAGSGSNVGTLAGSGAARKRSTKRLTPAASGI